MRSFFLKFALELIGKFCIFGYFYSFFELFVDKVVNMLNRVGIEIPKIEVRYKNLSIEGDVHVGSRALPTLLNSTLNTIEVRLLISSFKNFVKFVNFIVDDIL